MANELETLAACYWERARRERDAGDDEGAAFYARTEKALRRSAHLLHTLLDNDPDEPISDAGHVILDHWRHEVREFLGARGEEE